MFEILLCIMHLALRIPSQMKKVVQRNILRQRSHSHRIEVPVNSKYMFPKVSDTRILLSIAYGRIAEYDRAILELSDVVSWGDASADVYSSLGSFYGWARALEKALEILSVAYEKYPRDP